MLLAALALAAAPTEPPPPFFPPNPRDMRIVRMIDNTLPDPGADVVRLCQGEGRVCFTYHQRKGGMVTITIPFGRKH